MKELRRDSVADVSFGQYFVPIGLCFSLKGNLNPTDQTWYLETDPFPASAGHGHQRYFHMTGQACQENDMLCQT